MSGSEALFGLFPGLAPPTVPTTVPSVRAKRTVPPPRSRPTHQWVTRTSEPGVRGRPRKYPRALVGDVHGIWRVVACISPDAAGNECVRVTCPEEHERDMRAFNLRRKIQRCPKCPRP